MSVEASSGGSLQEDIGCGRCGYNLRGLLPADVCPECAHAISESIELHRRMQAGIELPLEQADRRWVGRLALGLFLILAAAVGYMTITAMVIWPIRIPDPLRIFSFWFINLPRVVGLWLFGTGEVRARKRRDGSILRYVALLDLILTSLHLGLRSAISEPRFQLMFTLIAIVGIAAFYRRLAYLCARLGAARLTLICKLMVVALPVALLARHWLVQFIIVKPNMWMNTLPHAPYGEIDSLVTVPLSLWNQLLTGREWIWVLLAALALTSPSLITLAGWRLLQIASKNRENQRTDCSMNQSSLQADR